MKDNDDDDDDIDNDDDDNDNDDDEHLISMSSRWSMSSPSLPASWLPSLLASSASRSGMMAAYTAVFSVSEVRRGRRCGGHLAPGGIFSPIIIYYPHLASTGHSSAACCSLSIHPASHTGQPHLSHTAPPTRHALHV